MKSTLSVLLLTLTVLTGTHLHADTSGGEYPRSQPQARGDYDDYIGDSEYDDGYEDDGRQGGYEYEEEYREETITRDGCRRRRCAEVPPAILPHPVPGYGTCAVVGQPWGWSIVLNGGTVLANGRPWEHQRLAIWRHHFASNGTCRYFQN